MICRYSDSNMEGEEPDDCVEDHPPDGDAEVPHCLLEGLLCDPPDVQGWSSGRKLLPVFESQGSPLGYGGRGIFQD